MCAERIGFRFELPGAKVGPLGQFVQFLGSGLSFLESGGRDRDRTGGLLVANEEKSEIRHGAAITYPFEGASSWTTWTTGLFAFSLCLFVLRVTPHKLMSTSQADEPSSQQYPE
jgi:hypothetical protein